MGGDWTATRYAPVSGGRRIAYCEYGDPEGQVVFYFHGCPGSRYEPAFGDEAGKERGYRIVALDRPGVGRSGYVKGRQLLDWPQDVVAVAEYLEIERFGVTGASGGGPYVLACCRAIPERLTFAAVMGSWAPVASDPALWAEMAPLDRFFGKLSRRVRWAFYAPFSLIGFAARWLSPQGFVKSLESSMSAADKAFVADEAVARFYAEDVKEAFRQGVQGPADDAIILYGDWGFDVAEIDVKVHIFHGKEDRFAPYRYALYLDERIPRTRLYPYPGKGHLFLLGLFDEVLAKISA